MTGIVLAGGRSSRFGSDKALAPWKGTTMLEAVLSAIKPLFPLVIVVARNLDRLRSLEGPGVRLVPDAFQPEHPLGGLHTGLSACPTAHAFACGCDMPLVNPALVRLVSGHAPGFDAVVPVFDGYPQPLFAVYSRDCLPAMGEMIAEGNLRMGDLARRVKARLIPEEEVRTADPKGVSFMDVDTPGDLHRAGGALE